MPKSLRTLLAFILFLFAQVLLAEPLNINTATAEQLDETLTGVGKAKAQAIVQDREKNGNFKSVDDLSRVKGIGPAIIEKNRSKITAEAEAPAPAGSTTPAPPPAQPAPPGKSP